MTAVLFFLTVFHPIGGVLGFGLGFSLSLYPAAFAILAFRK
jgi:hypothetical protein